MLLFFFYFFIVYFVVTVINLVFNFTKTIYILLVTTILTLLTSIFLLYCGFEFLALSFAMVYIGGIAVMFLFLILVIDVKVENTKKLFSNSGIVFLASFILSIIICFLIFVILNLYDPLQFNNINFFFYLDSNTFAHFNIMQTKFLPFLYFDLIGFSDLSIIGFYWFYSAPLILILIACHLFIAAVVAVFICSSIYERLIY